MPEPLPESPDLDQLRRQAKELRKAAQRGVSDAKSEVSQVSQTTTLVSAQLAIARRYGFANWSRLKLEVERKNVLQRGDVTGLKTLLQKHPELSTEPVSSCFANDGPLGYLGVARFHGLADHDEFGEITKVILDAGGLPNGTAGTREPPLITAASYGEVDIVRALVQSGADLEATGFAVPNGTALSHAVEFGNSHVVDLLVSLGAKVHDLSEAAGSGDLGNFLHSGTTTEERARALRTAAINERLDIIDQLLETGLTVDTDPETGTTGGSRTVLHDAAYAGKAASVRHLLALGAEPNQRDGEYGSTPLGWCQHRHRELAVFGDQLTAGHRAVETILQPLTNL